MPAFLRDLPIAITGASSGIGLATALRCAEAGMPVVLAARRTSKLDVAVAQIKSQGGRALAVTCDVNDKAACEELTDRTIKEFGSIYAIFANAGYGMEKAIDQLQDEEIEAMLRTNFWGSLWTIRPALEYFKSKGAGHVLMCSSCVSKIGLPRYGCYSTSKAMQDHFCRALRLELKQNPAFQNIHVSTVHPVGTTTEFFDVAAKNSGRDGLLIRSPRPFMQTADRVAKAIVASLYSPKGEIWTSFPMRIALGMAIAFPGITDALLSRAIASRAKAKEQTTQ